MKKILALLLALTLAMSLVACGGDVPPVEEYPAMDREQLLTLTQELCDVESELLAISAMGAQVKEGLVSEESALAAYDEINQKAAEVFEKIGSAQWTGDTYADAISFLKQAAEAMSGYTAQAYDAMAAGDEAALEEASALYQTYNDNLGELLTLLEG